MSINGLEWVVLAVLALALVGPNRLPDYAQGLARLIRRARDFALGAREQVRTELGPEFDDVDWKKYDPRRYHPRQIVRNALSEAWEDDDDPPVKPVSARMSTAKPDADLKRRAPSMVKDATSGTTTRKPTTPGRTVAAPRPARTARPAVLDGTPAPSPAPTTWSAAAAPAPPAATYDDDAT